MASALRLDPRFRWAVYAALAALFVTGAVWLMTDALKDSPNGEFWQQVSAELLMIHGGVAMVTLLLLGALIPTHLLRAWRSRQNRIAGATMAAANALLVVSAFGLYYAGSDVLRAWISDLHSAVGLIVPVVLVVHIALGRRSVRAASRRASR
jgi:hypothetical protein